MAKSDSGSPSKSTLRKTMRVAPTRPATESPDALFKAAALGQAAYVESLLSQAIEVDGRDTKGRTALIWAAMNGHPAVVHILLAKGADINAHDDLGRTPLMWAAVNGHISTVRSLLVNSANIHAKDQEANTALTLASAKDHKQIVSQLTQAGAVLGSWNDWNANPRARIVRQIPGGTLIPGAAIPGSGTTSVQIPRIRRSPSSVTPPVPAPAPAPAAPPPRSLKTILVSVAVARTENGQVSAITDVHSAMLADKLMELAQACGYNRSYIRAFAIPLMTKGKVRIDSEDYVERIGLEPRDLMDHEEASDLLEEFLISLPAEATETDPPAEEEEEEAPETVMHYAPGALSVETTVGGPTNNGITPPPMPLGHAAMMRAAMEGRATTLRILVEEGNDVNMRLLDGWTPLMCTSWNGHDACVKTLLEMGADIEARGADGWTALMIAAWNGRPEIVKILLDQGANPHACDNSGKTVLMWAVQNGNPDTVRNLISKKADVTARNNRGKTALYYARREQNDAVIKVLEKAGAQE